MKLFEGVKGAIHELLSPGYTARQAEAEYLRTMYRDAGTAVIRRNTWYRVMNEGGSLVGFEWNCGCGQAFQLLDFNLWSRGHVCPTCKTEINLLKATGAQDVPPQKWSELFSQLPMRPRLGGKPQSNVIDTWANDKSDEVTYEPHDLKFT
jgi:hypothetical protein